MDKGNNPIFSGMSAKVDIIIEAKNDTLIVGTSFVEKKNGKTAVLKKNGTSNVRTNVVTGISNPTNTEILSGVSEGDTIVRLVATGTGASTKTSLIPTGG
ncbi:efflux RND transporter periplasmic adaptor subunit [bacterium]|nr:efflux RND transporter periplasmic adaptor subunit [bacterium]